MGALAILAPLRRSSGSKSVEAIVGVGTEETHADAALIICRK